MKQIQHWIDGSFTAGASDRTGPVFNPATGEQTADVMLGSEADVDSAVKAAANAFESWQNSALTQRQNIMFAFREIVAARRREIAEALSARGIDFADAKLPEDGGPGHVVLTDPDGNPILLDQHVPSPASWTRERDPRSR